MFFSLIFLITLTAFAQGRSQDLALEVQVGRSPYRAGDTVVVGVRASIPPGYHLYGNPLGPGIGKPLNLYVNRTTTDWRAPWKVEWVEAHKGVPKRFNPPIGSWVWAYDNEAFFFVKGVLAFDEEGYKASADSAGAANDSIMAAAAAAARAAARTKNNAGARRTAPQNPPVDLDTARAVSNSAQYEITIDALICRTACVPVVKTVRFKVTADTGCTADTDTPCPCHCSATCPCLAFPAAAVWQRQFARSEPLEFKLGSTDSPWAAAGENGDGENQLNLGISGLGGLTEDGSEQTPRAQQGLGFYGPLAWDYTPFEENKREYGLLTAIIFALIAGLAMNLTPCIFPVLGIRVLSFAESARESRRHAVLRSTAFAGGIVAVFLLLAALAAFAGFSWGQQFQNPAIMVGIIALIFLFALGMFDFYTMAVPSSISNVGQKANVTLAGDFLKGAGATVMATPCAGPFLGALLAWALLQKPLIIFTLFAMMGVGMATPYILLSSSKKLMSLLPKPGRWIEDMKHAMGFLLLIFAVVLMMSLDPRLTLTAVGICLSILCAASLHKRFAPFGVPAGKRAAVVFIALALITAGTALSVKYLRLDIPLFNEHTGEPTSEKRVAWREFTPRALAEAHEEGLNVIVEFTAQWCSNCKINKAVVLNYAGAQKIYAEKNIVLMTADITNPNTVAQELLHHLGSRSVPFLAVFPADSPKNPIIMRDLLSKDRYLGTLGGLP